MTTPNEQARDKAMSEVRNIVAESIAIKTQDKTMEILARALNLDDKKCLEYAISLATDFYAGNLPILKKKKPVYAIAFGLEGAIMELFEDQRSAISFIAAASLYMKRTGAYKNVRMLRLYVMWEDEHFEQCYKPSNGRFVIDDACPFLETVLAIEFDIPGSEPVLDDLSETVEGIHVECLSKKEKAKDHDLLFLSGSLMTTFVMSVVPLSIGFPESACETIMAACSVESGAEKIARNATVPGFNELLDSVIAIHKTAKAAASAE